MARPDRISRPVRVLCLAILGLQLGAAAAIAETAGRSAAQSPAVDRVTAQALEGAVAEVALPVAAPETTAPPTTVPAPPTTVAPAPAPRPAPAPAPAPPPPPPPPPVDPAVRVQAAYERSVPAAWRSAISVRFQLIEGNTSWAAHDGTIQIGSAHANGSDAALRATVAHEFGHLIAFRYGSQAFNGAAPEGWPAYSNRPEEAWADCVSRAFSGVNDPSHGLPPCAGSSLSWTSSWVGTGPGSHARTGS
ncbi:MAG: hypothetical protein ACT4OV_01025 [Microthrixaceae bacterium]